MAATLWRCAAALALAACAFRAAAAVAAGGYSKGDLLTVECAAWEAPSAGEWVSPECIETGRVLALQYGVDGLTQCSMRGGGAFHALVLEGISARAPLRCRLARRAGTPARHVEFAVLVEAVRGRINGNYNAVVHASSGEVVAAAVYPVPGQPLPEAVAGITTMQFRQKWYAGSGLSVLMANRRAEEEFVISPVVAAMFCVLAACAVYVAGRVYVEGSLVPRILAKHGITVDADGVAVPTAALASKKSD
ncbi:hypothetical protein H4R21_002095 [Coemansia helicoidea]|uniref:Uncharacterized protein n=1 Tax=Coemansia helicoidea TaxID=1286919 RepID=A0ACC1L9Y2_9FUNG|nr:hypothetical protein H4R21_002095 [Coemansia helicoidea]